MAGKKLFGTSGVRGFTNKDITPELALGIGSAFGYLMEGGKVCIGRDTRYGAEMIAAAFKAGLVSQGCDVVECGCVPTPALACYISSTDATGGVMITGSHLPPDMLGIIPLIEDGAYIPDHMARNVEEIYESRFYENNMAEPSKIGKEERAKDVMEVYKKRILSHVDCVEIKDGRFKVAVDPGNGTSSGFLAEMLRELGCEVVEIHGEKRGYPERKPEPRAHTLEKLREVVVAEGCDIGAGLDIDADRVIFIDEKGKGVSEDVAGVIFADSIFLPGFDDVFVTPANSSGIVEWFSRERNITMEYCRIGQPATVEAIKKLDAKYSYEESGKYYFASEVNWCDGPLAVLKMLEIMYDAGKSLSEIVARYPAVHQVKHTQPLPPDFKDRIINAISERALEELGEGTAKVLDIDGYKMIYPDFAWLLLRPSGTEPILRVYSDSQSAERAEGLVEKGIKFIKSIMAECANV